MNIEQAAELLERAESSGEGIEPFSSRWGPVEAGDAWRVARARDARRRAAGFQQTGYKLGWTSEAMRNAFGITSPNYGSLWDYMQVDGVLDVSELIHPKAEPEFAFRVDSVLAGPRVTEDDVVQAGAWAVAIEVVDPRWTSYEFTWGDNTADGSSAARYCLGSWAVPTSTPATWSLAMAAGESKQEGRGAAALGSPAVSVAFLVHALHEAGEQLRPGMIVLTGGITPPVDLAAGVDVHVRSPQLGACQLVCRDAGAAA
jgi:2-oxo-3-hexenedioate decarboxylase